jgi:hypothetical protein
MQAICPKPGTIDAIAISRQKIFCYMLRNTTSANRDITTLKKRARYWLAQFFIRFGSTFSHFFE